MRKGKKRQNEKEDEKYETQNPKAFSKLFYFGNNPDYCSSIYGFAAKTTVSTVKAKNAKKQSKNVTVKYRKQMNRILEATQLYYSIRLNYSMQSGETKKIKLTSLEKQNVAAGRQVLEGQSRITNFAFSQRVKELFGANARIASLSFKTYPETPKELVVRCNSNYVKLAVGEWGEDYPVYKLKSVTKQGKKWKAVFKVNMYDAYADQTQPLGKVTLTLKKNKKSSYGFNITGITLRRSKQQQRLISRESCSIFIKFDDFFLLFCDIIPLLKYNQYIAYD